MKNKGTIALLPESGAKGLILDEAGLDLLRSHKITGYDFETGTITIQLPLKNSSEMNPVSVKLISVDGWGTKVDGKYLTDSLIGSSFSTDDELVDFIAKTMSGNTTTIADEALEIIRSQLGETVSLEGCVSTIKNDSILEYREQFIKDYYGGEPSEK